MNSDDLKSSIKKKILLWIAPAIPFILLFLIIIIALVSITGVLIHGFVDTVFFRPQIQFIFWIMVGIIRVVTNRSNNYVRTRN